MGALYVEVQVSCPYERLNCQYLIKSGSKNFDIIKCPTNIQKVSQWIPIETQNPIRVGKASVNLLFILDSKIMVKYTNMTASSNSNKLRTLIIIPTGIDNLFINRKCTALILAKHVFLTA